MRWKLATCKCVLTSKSAEDRTRADFWDVAFWDRAQRCDVHQQLSTIAELLPVLKDENQSMSFARARMAIEIVRLAGIDNTPGSDGVKASDRLEPEIAYSFDANRQITLRIPSTFTGSIRGAKLTELQTEVAKVDSRVRVQ